MLDSFKLLLCRNAEMDLTNFPCLLLVALSALFCLSDCRNVRLDEGLRGLPPTTLFLLLSVFQALFVLPTFFGVRYRARRIGCLSGAFCPAAERAAKIFLGFR